jgi:hypothetical protein
MGEACSGLLPACGNSAGKRQLLPNRASGKQMARSGNSRRCKTLTASDVVDRFNPIRCGRIPFGEHGAEKPRPEKLALSHGQRTQRSHGIRLFLARTLPRHDCANHPNPASPRDLVLRVVPVTSSAIATPARCERGDECSAGSRVGHRQPQSDVLFPPDVRQNAGVRRSRRYHGAA